MIPDHRTDQILSSQSKRVLNSKYSVVPIPTEGDIGEVDAQEKEEESGGLLSAPPTPPVMPVVSSYYKQFDDEPDPPGLVLKVLMYVGKVKEVAAYNATDKGRMWKNGAKIYTILRYNFAKIK